MAQNRNPVHYWLTASVLSREYPSVQEVYPITEIRLLEKSENSLKFDGPTSLIKGSRWQTKMSVDGEVALIERLKLRKPTCRPRRWPTDPTLRGQRRRPTQHRRAHGTTIRRPINGTTGRHRFVYAFGNGSYGGRQLVAQVLRIITAYFHLTEDRWYPRIPR